jgi:hypothetical protein
MSATFFGTPEAKRFEMKNVVGPQKISLRCPGGFNLGRVEQGLHDYAVLLAFLAQGAQLIGGGLRGANIELKADSFETYRHFF